MFLVNNALGFVAVLALILAFTKFIGLAFRHFGLPEVLGFIIGGILLGPAVFGDFAGVCIVGYADQGYKMLFSLGTKGASFGSNGVETFAKIGVLLLMFSTGLETDIQKLRKTGLAATLIACAGVAVPMGLGILICLPFGSIGLGPEHIYRCIFVGAILTATSVAITVSVFKEMGVISSKLGTTIVSAAIIDDVIGIVVLSIVTAIAKGGSVESANAFQAFKATPYGTIIMIAAFFVFAIGMGFPISKLFRFMEKRWPDTHRIPVFSLIVCFGYVWIAEEVFGVADITGAFLAGVILSTDHRGSEFTDHAVDASTYTLFAPVFFANIGITHITFSGMNGFIVLFAFLAVLMGLIGKVVGCGAVAKLNKYTLRESAVCGVGMMARGEVALIVTSTAMSVGSVDKALPAEFMLMTVFLILISSVLTPILLKLLYKGIPLSPELPPSESEQVDSAQVQSTQAESAQ